MALTPLTLLVDDSCPLVHVLREHLIAVDRRPPVTADGRALVDIVPNAFLDRFCDVVERMLTADGQGGAIRRVLDAGGWPVIMTHWQSLFSNGLETGLAALDLLGERVATALLDEVVWASCGELAAQTMQEAGLRDNGV